MSRVSGRHHMADSTLIASETARMLGEGGEAGTEPLLSISAAVAAEVPTANVDEIVLVPTGAAESGPKFVEERDEKPVIDWVSAPKKEIAMKYNLLRRAAFVMKGDKRVPFDPADGDTDKEGWLTGKGVEQYPVVGTSLSELASIGGCGLRLYFFVLKSLSFLFLACGVISIPAMVAFSGEKMYDHPAASHFSDASGVRQTLGSIHASDEDIEAGKVSVLWVASTTNCLVSLVLVLFTLWVGKRMNEIAVDTDRETITMSDYTIKITPKNDVEWSAYKVNGQVTRRQQEEKMLRDVETTLESTVPDSTVAEINAKPAIWIGWDEDEQIVLWRKKHAQLLDLEAALRKRHESGGKDETEVTQVVAAIEGTNSKLSALNNGPTKHDWVPDAVFAAFEKDDSYAAALKMGQVTIGNTICDITPAPEPEVIKWDHLEYSVANRRWRAFWVNFATLVILMLGVWGISAASNLKEASNLKKDENSMAEIWALVATVLIVIVNQALKFTVILTAGFGKAHTMGEEMAATTTRIFMCQFTNYVVLIILAKSTFLFFKEIPGDHYSNINAKWYALVAMPMLSALVIQFILVPIEHVFVHLVGLPPHFLLRLSATTQNKLNLAEAPILRDLSVGYGEVLLAMAVALIYGPAIPMLYFVASAGFAMRYWCEKWSDIVVSAKPPLLSKSLMSTFDEILACVVLLATMMSTYYVSTAGGLDPAAPRQLGVHHYHQCC